MIKMVVSSFYNTLIDNEEAIPVSTMLEIERIRKKGIIFSVGRYYNADVYINGKLTTVATKRKQTNILLDKFLSEYNH